MLSRDEALRRVEGATSVTDLFGRRGDPEARRRYRELAVALHPDRTGAGDGRAAAAMARLTRLRREWEHGAAPGTVEVRTAAGAVHRLGALHAHGSVSAVHRVESDRACVVKLARRPALNPLLHAEWAALRTLTRFTAEHRWLAPYYPALVDTSGVTGPGLRAFTVLESLVDGFVTLAEVRAAFPRGLDGRDYAWMHRRLLRAVAGAHRAGLVHGAIVAENVLVHPAQHGIVLAGWSFAVEAGQRPLATSAAPEFRAAAPPELDGTSPVTPATDVYMAHMLMRSMLAEGETRQRMFARGCTQPHPARRPSAADLLGEYDELLDELYGRRVFRPFALPTRRGA